MRSHNTRKPAARRAGFSLVEMLVVIAVIGTLTGMTIPAMSSIFGQAETSAVQRNAHNIVAHFNAARAAGNKTPFGDTASAITAITTGTGLSGEGNLNATTFVCPLNATDTAEAAILIDHVGTGAGLVLILKP